MSPLHSGLSKSSVYDTSGMRSYSVCLDSGDLAGDACKKDTRVYEFSLNRVTSAYAYKEDAPNNTCDKHVLVDYCATGNGVANEYCHKFAEVTDVEIVERALVKMSKSEIEEIKKAGDAGLSSAYLDGSYVYYEDGDWHGFSGNANKNAEAPYLICSEHSQESWEAYEKAEQEKAEQERLEQERLEQERLEQEQQQQQASQPVTP